MTQTASALEWLQAWYRSQCDGAWEHEHGIAISTLDNPGWSVVVDLKGTSLEERNMRAYAEDRGETDWVFLKVEGTKFIGHGDSSKLAWIIDQFRVWAENTT
jgi:Immunity protein 53